MLYKKFFSLITLGICLISFFVTPQTSYAAGFNAYDVLAAVNALRTSNGLTPYQADGALMAAAQAHSDYQASIGTATHEGAGGTSSRDRAVAAGYGKGAQVFVTENIAVIATSGSMDTVISSFWSDQVHWNTMVNPQYQQAGAGVTEQGGMLYITLDVGYIAGSTASANTSQGVVAPPAPQSAPTETPQFIVNVVTATPLADGSIYHTVQYGEFLVNIAQSYGLTMQQLKDLNNMHDDYLKAGQRLKIRDAMSPTPSLSPTATPRPPTRTPTASATIATPTLTRTPTQTRTPTPKPLIPPLHSMDRRVFAYFIIAVCSLGLVMVLVNWLRK
jgi:LysM repeat protein